MLTAEGCLARRQRLWNQVASDASYLVITDPRHVQYFCNFWVNPISFSAGEQSILVLDIDGNDRLFVDNFTLRSASTTPHNVSIETDSWYDHKHSVIDRNRAIARSVSQVRDSFGDRRGLAEQSPATLAGFANGSLEPAIEYDLSRNIRELRRQKHDDEIALLQQCMRAGEAGHRRAREVISSGVSEFDVYREVQNAAMTEAGRPVIVYGDFRATNAKTPKAGGLPTNYQLKSGDLFILDYSVVIDGYRSDFTNTYSVGEPTDEQIRMSTACIEAIAAGEQILRSGVKATAVYSAVSSVLESSGFGPLKHHAGHGLGLAHPEPPILVPESIDELVVGDVITLEPGSYVEGVGGMRFEHNYLITSDGFERLSNHKLGL